MQHDGHFAIQGTNRKLEVDFLYVIIRHFFIMALRANMLKAAFVEGVGQFEAKY